MPRLDFLNSEVKAVFDPARHPFWCQQVATRKLVGRVVTTSRAHTNLRFLRKSFARSTAAVAMCTGCERLKPFNASWLTNRTGMFTVNKHHHVPPNVTHNPAGKFSQENIHTVKLNLAHARTAKPTPAQQHHHRTTPPGTAVGTLAVGPPRHRSGSFCFNLSKRNLTNTTR